MNFQLLPIEEKDLKIFKNDMQEAFQQGAMAWKNILMRKYCRSHILISL